MKKISKILIVLITIFMLIVASIINNNAVYAAGAVVSAAGKTIGKAGDIVADAAGDAVATAGKAATAAKKTIGKAGDIVVDAAGDAVDAAGKAATAAGKTIGKAGDVIADAAGGAVATAGKAATAAGKTIGKAGEIVVDAAGDAVDAAGKAATAAGKTIGNAGKAAIDTAGKAIGTAVDTITGAKKDGDTTAEDDGDVAEEEEDGLGAPGPLKIITTALDGIVGILFLIQKTVFLIILYTAGQVINLAAGGEFSVESIIFNQAVKHPIGIISISFFDSKGSNKSGTNELIQENIATWYVAIRNIAITILVIVAMYIAIRMLLATTSEKKAQYKEILIYWIQSLALVFVLHYIMVGIIAINDALVNSLYKAGEQVITGKNNNIMETLFINAFKAIRVTTSLANTLAYMVLCVVTIMFFISYLKRMMTTAFLIIIAPLVTVTYSIDKIGDGKSQALNAWLKEFSYTVLIQPFHCITYLALGSIGTQLLERNNSFGDIFIGIYFLSFILQSENIVRGIFGITPNNITNVAGEIGLLTAVAGKLSGNKNKGIQYSGDSKTNRFIGEAERSGGQKRLANRSAQTPQSDSNQSTKQPTTAQSQEKSSQDKPKQNTEQKPPQDSSNTQQSQPKDSSDKDSTQNVQPVQDSNTQTTQGTDTDNAEPSNWYDHYNEDDARREELNNKQNRTATENSELANINNKAINDIRKRRKIRRAANAYVGISMGVAGAMAKMALAIASGDGKALIAAGFSAKDSIKNNMDNAVERATRGDMIDAYKLARKVSPDKDDNYFKDLAKGKISPSNDHEQEFVDSLSKHQDIMDKHGKIDDKKLDKQTDTLLDNINSGDLDQHSAIYRAGKWIGRRKSN